MKYLRLFENFTDGDKYPSSITVKPTAEFERQLKNIKNSEGKPSFLALSGEFTLERNGDIFNLVKVATTPFEVTRNELDGKSYLGRQDDHWLSYDPKNSEIYVNTSRRFGTEFKFDDNEITSTDRRYSTEDYRDVGLIWIGGYYCKFEKGFEVGMKDHRGYFEITSVKN
jgi:hypothetical protein